MGAHPLALVLGQGEDGEAFGGLFPEPGGQFGRGVAIAGNQRGQVTFTAYRDSVGKSLGLGLVKPGRAGPGDTVSIEMPGRPNTGHDPCGTSVRPAGVFASGPERHSLPRLRVPMNGSCALTRSCPGDRPRQAPPTPRELCRRTRDGRRDHCARPGSCGRRQCPARPAQAPRATPRCARRG